VSEASEDKSIKKSLLGWATGALNKLQTSLEPPAPKPGAAAPSAAPRPAPRPAQTGDLFTPTNRKSGTLQLPKAAARGAQTGELDKPIPRVPLEPPAGSGPLPSMAATPEEEAAESKKRLALILAYMKNPEGDPTFKNKPLMYRILTEERTYQQGQIAQMNEALAQMPPPAAHMGLTEKQAAEDPVYAGLEERRAELQKRIDVSQTRQTQLFMLMKKLTGKTGKTGGTGFLAPSAD
jgi:hypothetical protein